MIILLLFLITQSVWSDEKNISSNTSSGKDDASSAKETSFESISPHNLLVIAQDCKIVNKQTGSSNSHAEERHEKIYQILSKNQVVAIAKCNEEDRNTITVMPYQNRSLLFNGKYSTNISIISNGNESILMKEVSVPETISLKTKSIILNGNISASKNISLYADNIEINERTLLRSEHLIFRGNKFINQGIVEGQKIYLESNILDGSVNNCLSGIMTAHEDIILSNFKLFKNSGIIRAGRDIVLNGHRIKNSPESRMFANGVFKVKAYDLEESSFIVAGIGAFFHVETWAQFLNQSKIYSRYLIDFLRN